MSSDSGARPASPSGTPDPDAASAESPGAASSCSIPVTKTPVSLLQELYVKRGITPKYDLVQIEGAVHEPTFKYRVTVGDFVATGCGQSKKKAKHTAAKAVLDKIRAMQRHQLKHEAANAPTATTSTSDGNAVVCKRSDMIPIIPELEVADLASPYDDRIEGNPVGELQEICMNRRMQPPIYEGQSYFSTYLASELLKSLLSVSLEEGQPHERKFVIVCKVGKYQESGNGKSKKLAKRQSASRMLKTLQTHPLDNDMMGGPVGEGESAAAAAASLHTIDEDDLAQGMALQRSRELKQGKAFTQSNLSIFYRNLKCGKGTVLAALQDRSREELLKNGEKILDEIAAEQCFSVTYVDIEEKSTTDQFHTIVQISTVPVAVCFGVGDTEEESKAAAAFNGCLYLQLMTNNPRAAKTNGREPLSENAVESLTAVASKMTLKAGGGEDE